MIVHKGHLVLAVDQPEAIRAVIPHAKISRVNGRLLVAVPHRFDEVQALKNIGLKPPPIQIEFNYPGRFKPFEHQKKCVDFLVQTKRGFNLSDPGTGKTAAALWASEYLRQKGYIRRVLITAPLSVMSVWEEEAFNLLPHRSFCKLLGSKARRLDLLNEGSDICVINHDGASTIQPQLKGKFDLIINDEATVHKNAQTKRYKLFRDLVKEVRYLWLLTGTPVTKAPTDAYALVKLVNPLAFKGGFVMWKEMTMTQVSSFKWVPKIDSKDFVYRHLQPAIRFKKEDCIDLPPITYVNRTCELTDQQKIAFKNMKQKLVMERAHEDGEKITAANAAVKLLKLIQICCGVVKDNDGEHYGLDASTRLDTLGEIIEETGGKVIIFVPFIGVMDAVMQYLKEKGWSAALVNGSVSEKNRSRIFEEFQKGDLECLVAHPKTTSHGLTLTASNSIVWYGPIYSTESYIQANARIHRQGQKNKCTVYHIVSTSLEAQIFKALWSGVQLGNQILQMYQEVVQ